MAEFFNNLGGSLMTLPSAMTGTGLFPLEDNREDFSRFRGRPEEEEGGEFNGEDFFISFGENDGNELTLRLYNGDRVVSQVADHFTQLELYGVVAFLNLSSLYGDRVLQGHRLTFQAAGMEEVNFEEVMLIEDELAKYMNVPIQPIYIVSAEAMAERARIEVEEAKRREEAKKFGRTSMSPTPPPKGRIINSKMELGTINTPLVWIHDTPINDAPNAMEIKTRGSMIIGGTPENRTYETSEGPIVDMYWNTTDAENIFTFNNAEDAKRMLQGIILVEHLLEPVGVKPGDLFRTHNLKLPHYISVGMDGDDAPGPLLRLELDEFEFEGLAGFITAFNLNVKQTGQFLLATHLEPAKALFIREDADEIRRMFEDQNDYTNPDARREFEDNWEVRVLERGHIFEKPHPGAYLIRQLYGAANGRLYIPQYTVERYLKGAKMGHRLYRERINVNVSDVFPLGGPDGNRLLYH